MKESSKIVDIGMEKVTKFLDFFVICGNSRILMYFLIFFLGSIIDYDGHKTFEGEYKEG